MTTDASHAEPHEAAGSLREAFRHLHGARLHGFALLVTLGDARRAERAAGEALAAGELRAGSLRHPERAAAWIRSQALPALRGAKAPGKADDGARRAALAVLGVDDASFDGLVALSFNDRVALVASAVERFEPLDIETILGTDPAASRRAVDRARHRYLTAVTAPRRSHARATASAGLPPSTHGELARRVRSIADRTFGGPESGAQA